MYGGSAGKEHIRQELTKLGERITRTADTANFWVKEVCICPIDWLVCGVFPRLDQVIAVPELARPAKIVFGICRLDTLFD